MTSTSTARRRGMARLLVLCAVLFGLFLMHGAPATAAEGCHGAMSANAPMADGHADAGMESATPPAMPHAGAQQASTTASMDGGMCVSTPARDMNPLPTGGLMAVVAVLAIAFIVGRRVPLGRSGRRGPPQPGGRSLLLQVCIART
ncbi:hypothetical protein ABZ369_02790 [Streptomyces sp. NPDC005918]|uniref:hypothetical protein n=1 Tax=Streptomyces sp. NPDC005918 TaxID=3155454 RepID=UPI003406A201